MHYYSFNIGDYASHTSRLTPIEDIAYRRMLDLYYLNEQPLKGCEKDVAREIGLMEYLDSVEYVLSKFFVKEENVFRQKRIDVELKKYASNAKNKSKAGKASAKARQAKASKVVTGVEQVLNTSSTDEQLNNNHKPITNNQETVLKELRENAFNIFYCAGLVKKSKVKALSNFISLVKQMDCDPIEFAELLKKDIEYRINGKQFGIDNLHPSTYLNQQRWTDEYDSQENNNGLPQAGGKQSASERTTARNNIKYGSEQPSGGLGLATDGRDLREPMGEGEWGSSIPHVEDRS